MIIAARPIDVYNAIKRDGSYDLCYNDIGSVTRSLNNLNKQGLLRTRYLDKTTTLYTITANERFLYNKSPKVDNMPEEMIINGWVYVRGIEVPIEENSEVLF